MPSSLADLDINGKDLEEIGIFGKEIKTTLGKLLLLAAEGKVKNQKEALIKAALEF